MDITMDTCLMWWKIVIFDLNKLLTFQTKRKGAELCLVASKEVDTGKGNQENVDKEQKTVVSRLG